MSILRILTDAGMTARLTDDGRIAIRPATRLTDDLQRLVRDRRQELVAELEQAHALAVALVGASMRACDNQGDDDEARRAMRTDCRETPPHLRPDLLAHFRSTYPTKKP